MDQLVVYAATLHTEWHSVLARDQATSLIMVSGFLVRLAERLLLNDSWSLRRLTFSSSSFLLFSDAGIGLPSVLSFRIYDEASYGSRSSSVHACDMASGRSRPRKNGPFIPCLFCPAPPRVDTADDCDCVKTDWPLSTFQACVLFSLPRSAYHSRSAPPTYGRPTPSVDAPLLARTL